MPFQPIFSLHQFEGDICTVIFSQRNSQVIGRSWKFKERRMVGFCCSMISHFTKLYLDILIHEMHRAVFVLYECVRQQEYRKECKTLWGHDVYWQAAAQAIEKSVLLGWHPKLYRCASLVGDLCSRGSNLPNVAVLRSLDLDVAEIKSEQTRVRFFLKPEGKRRDQKNPLPFKTYLCIREDCTVDAFEDAVYRRTRWDFWR